MQNLELGCVVSHLEDGERFVVKIGFEFFEYDKETYLNEPKPAGVIALVESIRYSKGFNLILIECEVIAND